MKLSTQPATADYREEVVQRLREREEKVETELGCGGGGGGLLVSNHA